MYTSNVYPWSSLTRHLSEPKFTSSLLLLMSYRYIRRIVCDYRYTLPPMVDTKKWLTNGKHNTNICDRWQQNKFTMAATAWISGIGLESWENNWGTWSGMTPRDSALFKRLGAILRFAGGQMHGGSAQDSPVSERSLLQSGGWQPYSPLVSTANGQVFASTFPSGNTTTPDEVLMTLVGYADTVSPTDFTDVWLSLPVEYKSYRAFDCYKGVEITMPSGSAAINFTMTIENSVPVSSGSGPKQVSPSGFGALLLRRNGTLDAPLAAFLAAMQSLTEGKPLGGFTCEGGRQCVGLGGGKGSAWAFYETCNNTHCAGLLQTMDPIPPTATYSTAPKSSGGSMVSVAGGAFLFESDGVEWKGDTERSTRGVGFQFGWERSPSRFHNQEVSIPSLWVGKYPVTNNQYAAYLNVSGYKPADEEHWLQHWGGSTGPAGSSTPSAEQIDEPVVYISLADARAFCGYHKLRLPHAYEWQWFAGGSAGDGRLFPWGNHTPNNATIPRPVAGGVGVNLTAASPSAVNAQPGGCAPSGACDLTGNTWEMTDAFTDQHNRAVLLKGGSHYSAKGSMWYFPNALQINRHEKAFLFSDGYERSGTVGFRCVADSAL